MPLRPALCAMSFPITWNGFADELVCPSVLVLKRFWRPICCCPLLGLADHCVWGGWAVSFDGADWLGWAMMLRFFWRCGMPRASSRFLYMSCSILCAFYSQASTTFFLQQLPAFVRWRRKSDWSLRRSPGRNALRGWWWWLGGVGAVCLLWRSFYIKA